MLPTLENPPKNTVFILCTTDTKKIIKTIKTRVTSFEVDQPTPRQLGPFLTSVFAKEGVEVPKDVVKEIIKRSDGSIRKSLTISNKVISLSTDEMLKSLTESQEEEDCAKKLIKALECQSKWSIVASLLKGIKKGEEESFRQFALVWYSNGLLGKGEGRYSYLIDKFSSNFFESGKAGLISTCWEITEGI
jgi:DNA polymerase-3 subunit gamma/tau